MKYSKFMKLPLLIISTIWFCLYIFNHLFKKNNLKQLKHPSNIIIGRSHLDKPIYMYTNDVIDQPAVLLIGSVHGDETPGVYACRHFFDTFTSDEYIDINNNIKIYVIPTLNPDNFEKRRNNAENIDLNRDFFSDKTNDKATETQVLMKFLDSHPDICLTITFHSGALVMCYPLDQPRNYNSKLRGSRSVKRGLSGPKAEPIEYKILKDLCVAYSKHHGKTNNSYEKQMYQSETFPQGVCNGSHWYPINGSLGDYCYLKYGIPSLTAEISEIKNPSYASQMGPENFNSILETIKTMLGNSISGVAPMNSIIEINNQDKLSFRTFKGRFFRTCSGEIEIRAKLNNKYSTWVKCKKGDNKIVLSWD